MMEMTISDRIQVALDAPRAPEYILLSPKQMQAYKRELMPETLPEEAYCLLGRIRVSRGKRTAIVATALQVADGRTFINAGTDIMRFYFHPSNPVVDFQT